MCSVFYASLALLLSLTVNTMLSMSHHLWTGVFCRPVIANLLGSQRLLPSWLCCDSTCRCFRCISGTEGSNDTPSGSPIGGLTVREAKPRLDWRVPQAPTLPRPHGKVPYFLREIIARDW